MFNAPFQFRDTADYMMEMTVAKYSVPLRTQSACWLALAVFALSGCGSDKTDTATSSKNATKVTAAKVPAGSTVETDAVNGYSVVLPKGYKRMKDKAALRAMVQKAAEANPGLKTEFEQYASVVDRVPVFALKLGKTFNNNINILVTAPGGGTEDNIGDLYSQVPPVIEGKLGAKITDHKVMDLAGTKALRVDYRMKAGTEEVLGTQVYLVHNGKLLIVAITVKDASAGASEKNAIINGLRLN